MRTFILSIFILLLVAGCFGTGFEKRATLVPDSVSIGYMQEKYRSQKHAWDGISISATWEFK